MDRFAIFIAMVAFYIAWVLPFLIFKATAPKREAQVTVNSSRWGVGIQMLAYFCAWVGGPGSKPPAILALAAVFGCLGVVLSWTAIRNLGKQLRIHAGLYEDHELVRKGPYRIVRHPIYAGMLSMYVMTALTQPRWILAVIGFVLAIIGLEIRVRIEDSLLASRFGRQFEEYKSSTAAYVPLVR
jgi:protein-S-isoprenylcysteine O-methyltransferase Ste14